MQILSLNFLLYSIGGVWRPIGWSSTYSKRLYSLITFFALYLLNFSMLTQLMDIVLVVDNVDEFTTTLLMFLSAVSAFSKAITAVTRRGEIINLIKMLEEEPCKPCTREELDIQMGYDRLIRSYSINYMLLALFSAVGATVGEIFAILQGQLPYRIWVPYNYTLPLLFWTTSLQEMLALVVGTFVNIATETLILGFCLQTCAQLDIFKHRLQEMMKRNEEKEIIWENSMESTLLNKTNRLSGYIRYHLCIIRYAKLVNEVFGQVLFLQFFASILILCSSVYYLSSHVTVADFVKLGVYTFCMFVQIFVYCWAGNEVILKSIESSDAAYHIDWLLMTISERKDLLMIMKRSTRPIKFTSSFLVTLSLNSYVNILKASYSAFNVLHNNPEN